MIFRIIILIIQFPLVCLIFLLIPFDHLVSLYSKNLKIGFNLTVYFLIFEPIYSGRLYKRLNLLVCHENFDTSYHRIFLLSSSSHIPHQKVDWYFHISTILKCIIVYHLHVTAIPCIQSFKPQKRYIYPSDN